MADSKGLKTYELPSPVLDDMLLQVCLDHLTWEPPVEFRDAWQKAVVAALNEAAMRLKHIESQ